MDFMTQEYVKQEAEKGTLPALKCSLEHHRQGATADWVKLKDAIMGDNFHLGPQLCACCQKFEGEKCPLDSKGCGVQHCCGGKFQMTVKTLNTLQVDYSNANFKAFQEAEADLCKYIEGKIAEEEDKKTRPYHGGCVGCKTDQGRCEGCKYYQPDWNKPDLSSKKCKALDKPELRHGMIVKGSVQGPAVVIGSGRSAKAYYENGEEAIQFERGYVTEGVIVESIFDDLAAIGEPLEEFTRDDLKAQKSYNRFGFKINKTCIDYEGDNYVSLNLEEIEETILNLRRMVVKLKTK